MPINQKENLTAKSLTSKSKQTTKLIFKPILKDKIQKKYKPWQNLHYKQKDTNPNNYLKKKKRENIFISHTNQNLPFSNTKKNVYTGIRNNYIKKGLSRKTTIDHSHS